MKLKSISEDIMPLDTPSTKDVKTSMDMEKDNTINRDLSQAEADIGEISSKFQDDKIKAVDKLDNELKQVKTVLSRNKI